MSRGFCLEVSGDYACFTRPEMKVERVSYDVITPSAARGIFEAILWKPAIKWHIRKIEVMNPVKWINIRRNEVASVASNKNGIYIEDVRQQRAGLLLKDVKYRLYAEFEFIPQDKRQKVANPVPDFLIEPEEKKLLEEIIKARPDEKEEKYAAMFYRRAGKGQCFHQPYLGCREFPAVFRLVKNDTAVPIQKTDDLGWMLYDMDFSDPKDIKPMFFRAKMEKGVIVVPDESSGEVAK